MNLQAAKHKAKRLIQSGRVADGELINNLLDRIAELEHQVDVMTDYDRRIKAEGIREMLDGGTMYCGVNDTYYEDDIREYADKLEGKDEQN